MFRKFFQQKKFAAKTLSAILAVALSSMMCFCCFQMASEAKETEFCPLSKTSHCKFAKTGSSETTREKLSPNYAECCDLKLNVFIATLDKKDFPNPKLLLVGNLTSFLPTAKLQIQSKTEGLFYRPPPLAKDNLSIKNCVFRI